MDGWVAGRTKTIYCLAYGGIWPPKVGPSLSTPLGPSSQGLDETQRQQNDIHTPIDTTQAAEEGVSRLQN
jgi:hypothetical protein